MLKLIYYYIFVPGFVFTAVAGLLATWVDRKVTARLQWRSGPPWFQPFADILKLLGKEVIVPDGSQALVFLAAPLIGLAAVTLVSMMLWLFNINPYGSFIGDLFVIYYLLTIPPLACMIGASASRNPFSALGASREMKMMLAYELPFIISTFSMAARAGTMNIGGIISYQAAHGANIATLSGAAAFVVSLLVIQAKLGFVPFDSAEAEQEIMSGTTLEYSGAPLAVFKLTKAMLLFTLPVFLITLYMGGTGSIAGFLGKYLMILVLIILIKNTNPRLRVDQAVRFFWGPATVLAILGFILNVIGR